MHERGDEAGVLAVLPNRLGSIMLPRALGLQEKAGRGERLDDTELAFLENALGRVGRARSAIDKDPQRQEMAARRVSLYYEITQKALGNEPEKR